MTRKQAPINFIRLRDYSERLVVQAGPRKRLWRVERMEDLEVAPDSRGKPMLNRDEIIAKFESLIEVSPDGCWLWTGGTNELGYGKFNVNCGTNKAHRVSWIIYRGPIPAGQNVLHHCDVPRCVWPHHLFIGSHRDNSHDCISKGRNFPLPHHRGEEANNVKLYERDVRRIRELVARGVPQDEIASQFGVTPQNIRAIRIGLTWRWLT